MRKVSISFLLIISICLFQACNDEKTEKVDTSVTDSTKVSNADTGTVTDQGRTDQMLDQDTKDFVMKAASGGMMEVELGNVALQKAHSQRVKDYANMIVTDHTKANDELKSIATSKSITLPSSMMPDQQKSVDMMKDKSGANFDKSYINMMVDDHKKDISEFKKASQNVKDAAIKGFATNALPVLQKHLDSAQAIRSKM